MAKIDIFNMALQLLGHDRLIEDITEATTENTRCSLHWDGSRKSVLSAHPWNWLLQETPYIDGCECDCDDYTGDYMYDYPSDYLRLWAVLDLKMDRVEFRAANGQIFCKEPEVRFRYVEDEEDTDLWPDKIQMAVAAEIASRIAYSMTQSEGAVKAMSSYAVYYLQQAKVQDAQENTTSGKRRKYANSRK